MSIIVGVDEAGRGALIGDVVAAAVILPSDYDATLLVDSKTLNEETRFARAQYIKTIAVDYAIGCASPAEIDMLNIHHATLLAMQRALQQLQQPYDKVWVDGKFTPVSDKPALAIVKGDSLHACISAASILAKTYRDTQLIALDKEHAEYGFARHKGYPTKAHIEAITRFGILPAHRKSYKTISRIIDKV